MLKHYHFLTNQTLNGTIETYCAKVLSCDRITAIGNLAFFFEGGDWRKI